MRKTIQQQIAANKRASFVYAIFMVVLLAALGACIVGIYRPSLWYYGALGAAGLGLIVALVARTSGTDIMLSITGARPANHEEDQVLTNVAEEMALAAGIPMPQVYVIDSRAPNAFATGNDPAHAYVVFTTGLIAKLDRDELQGVMAHELSHVRNYDIQFMTVISIIAGFIPLLADAFRFSTWFGGTDSEDKDAGAGWIFLVLGLVLSIVAPIFALILQLAISRQREYLADASAAELTRYPLGLASALEKINDDPAPLLSANRATQHMFIVNPLKGQGGTSLFDTHPPISERILRLRELAGMPAAALKG